MAGNLLDAYGALVALAERERDLIAGGRWGDLAEVERDRARLAATLPARPPADARHLLERARDQVLRNAEQIAAAIEQTRAELELISRGRRAVTGYAAAPASGRFVDERR
jgi:hypothetical protein